MADAVSFRMVNDQSGEEVNATLADEMDYRARGFRIVDTGRYDAAVGQRNDQYRAPVVPNPYVEAAAAQTQADALLVAQNTFGGAEGAAQGAQGARGDDAKREQYMQATVPQLKQYAEQNNIDLSGAERKDDIVDRILAAEAGE